VEERKRQGERKEKEGREGNEREMDRRINEEGRERTGKK